MKSGAFSGMTCKKYLLVSAILLIMFQGGFAQKKLAQTGFQFLSVNPDARTAALAGAMTTVSNYSGAILSNPAMLAEMEIDFDVMFSRNNWIADITHNASALAYKPFGGQYGVVGLSILMVDYGDVEGTIRADNEQGYLETGIINPSAYAIGIGYAKQLSNRFSIGGQIKMASQYLGPALRSISLEEDTNVMDSMDKSVMAFDFGTVYKTGFRSLVFGMSVRNFSEEIKYAEEGFQLPLTFSIGFSYNVMEFLPENYRDQTLLFTLDAVHPRSYPEYIKMGAEYRLLETFALRLGYVSDMDETNLSYGLGVSKYGLGFDYAYTPFGVFDNVQRVSIHFSM